MIAKMIKTGKLLRNFSRDDRELTCLSRRHGKGKDNGDYGCTDPPSAEILGFPTGPCGPLFDITIDNRLGFYDFSGNFSASLRQFAPGLPSYDINVLEPDATTYNDLADPELVRRMLRKRGWNIFKAIVKVVKAVVQPIINTVRNVIINKVTNVVNQALRVIRGLVARLTNIQGSYSRIFDTGRIGPGANSNSPWGRQYRIFQVTDSDNTDNLDYALSGWQVQTYSYRASYPGLTESVCSAGASIVE